MGTKAAPNYAVNFMNRFEENSVYTYQLQPMIWVRYIDDIFMIWQHGEEELNLFTNYLNNCHPTIKFTVEKSNEEVSFLDTKVLLQQDGSLKTSLFCKPTDAHNFLHFSSCHPKHMKTGLPYSQFLRVRRICSDLEDYKQNAQMLASHFLRRGYPAETIQMGLLKAQNMDRNSLIHPPAPQSAPNTEPQVFAVTTFHPSFKDFRNIITENWDHLSRSPATRDMHTSKIIFGNRRPKNLREHLVKAKLPFAPRCTNKPARSRCKTRDCRYCPRINVSGRIKCRLNGRDYSTRTQVDCKSNNLVYCISCKRCSKQYVGQTKRRLMDRMCEHYRTITREDPAFAVGSHFSSSNGHQGLEDIDIYVLEFMDTPSTDALRPERETVEKKWAHRLRSFFPWGLNTQD